MTLRRVPVEALRTPVGGVNLAPGTLADQLAAHRGPAGETLLVFLRHFGCIFCRETVAELRAAAEKDPAYPPVLFFFQGTPTEGRAFLRRYWREARAVADPERQLYAAFGVTRGSVLQLFGPGVWRAASRAREKGHEQGPAQGNVLMMPGVFLVRGADVVWTHRYRHAGDHPDFARIPERAAAARPEAGQKSARPGAGAGYTR